MSGFWPATAALAAFGALGKATANPRSGDWNSGHCGASCLAVASVFCSWAIAPVAAMAAAASSAAAIFMLRIDIADPR
jgi:hypothetical protein